MKNTMKAKRIFSLLTAVVLLCLPCLLASCETESPENTSSTESIAPPTHAELFWEAVCTVGDYFGPMEATFGMPLFTILTGSEDGTETEILNIEKVAAMNVNLLGDQPVRKEAVTKTLGNLINTSGTWYAAGDEILFEELANEDLEYFLLPEVQADPYALTSGGGLSSMLSMDMNLVPDGLLDSLETAVKELFTDEMILIAKSDVVDTYTITMDPETAKAFDAILEENMKESGMDGLFGTGDLTNNEGIEVSGGTSELTKVLVLNVAEGKNYQLKLSTMDNGTAVSVAYFTISVNGAVTTLQYTVTEGETEVSRTSCTFTVAANNLKMEAEMVENGNTTTADLTVSADEVKKLTFKGDINTSYVVEGMTLAIPIAVSGTYHDTENEVKTTFALSASVSGLLELAVSGENVFVPGTPEVKAPQADLKVTETNMDTLIQQMEATYPSAAALYQTLMGLTEFDPGTVPNQ